MKTLYQYDVGIRRSGYQSYREKCNASDMEGNTIEGSTYEEKYVSRLLAGCLTVTMLTPTGALASVPQPVVTQEASQVAGQENETENKEQAEEYAAEGAAEVQTDETEAAENRTAADTSREQTEPQTAQTGEQAEPQTTQTSEQAVSEAEPQAQVQPRAVVAVNQWIGMETAGGTVMQTEAIPPMDGK